MWAIKSAHTASGVAIKISTQYTIFRCPHASRTCAPFWASQISWHIFPQTWLTQNTVNICLLLKRETAFVWGEAQQSDFERAKKILLSDTVVKPFVLGLRTELVTDASTLHGLGFAFLQFEESVENPRLITFGNCVLTPAQTCYAVCELEALGIQYALEKCAFYLRGAPRFQVTTDHRPLVGIWATDLALISNPRLLHIRMKTTGALEYKPDRLLGGTQQRGQGKPWRRSPQVSRSPKTPHSTPSHPAPYTRPAKPQTRNVVTQVSDGIDRADREAKLGCLVKELRELVVVGKAPRQGRGGRRSIGRGYHLDRFTREAQRSATQVRQVGIDDLRASEASDWDWGTLVSGPAFEERLQSRTHWTIPWRL